MRFFATAIPGIGAVLREELTDQDIAGEPPENDGRNDIVAFQAPGSFEPSTLRTSEDVYAEVRSVSESGPAKVVIQRLWDDRALERAMSVYGSRVRPLAGVMTFRVIARVLAERTFTRRALRDALAARIASARPRWRPADVASVELWILETKPAHFRLGVRLTTASMRHRDGRAAERAGALRPTVAAAMVRLAKGDGTLLDVTCGSGTIVAEAAATGRRCVGADIDEDAIWTSRQNVPAAGFTVADARALPIDKHSVGAVASNLPFGERFEIEGDPRAWFDHVLREVGRVAAPKSPIVLLVPSSDVFRAALDHRHDLALERTLEVTLLGMRTRMWSLRRD